MLSRFSMCFEPDLDFVQRSTYTQSTTPLPLSVSGDNFSKLIFFSGIFFVNLWLQMTYLLVLYIFYFHVDCFALHTFPRPFAVHCPTPPPQQKRIMYKQS